MSHYRISCLPLLMLMAVPSVASAQGHSQGPASSSAKGHAQSQSTGTRSQPSQSQPQQSRQNMPSVSDRTSRRAGADLPSYGGQDSYRTGVKPPVVQERHDSSRDRETFRKVYRAEHRYDVRPYVRPRGWYHRDWVLGDILPVLFWTRSYWIISYWLYDLPIPPVGCIWVRYGNDALLIDRQTGEVIQVIYDIFY